MTLRNAIELIATLKQERLHREVFLLRDSIQRFKSLYSFLTGSYLKQQSKFMVPNVDAPEFKRGNTGQQYHQFYPNEILEDQLFLGDANHATSKYVIKNLKITHIVNVTDDVNNEFEAGKIDSFSSSESD